MTTLELMLICIWLVTVGALLGAIQCYRIRFGETNKLYALARMYADFIRELLRCKTITLEQVERGRKLIGDDA